MPKAPRHHSILREIRRTLGWNQEELGRRIGTAVGTINRIENGTLTISRRLALRLYWLTGVDWKDIVANRKGRPQTRYGPLDRTHLDRLVERARTLSDKEFDSLRDNAKYFFDIVLVAARIYAPHKLWAIDAAILCASEELLEEFHLEPGIEQANAEIAEETRKNRPPEKQKASEAIGEQFNQGLREINASASTPRAQPPKKPGRRPVSPGSGNGS
jgi:transcriptional regulator with XRE-family HTH domain